MTPDLPPPPSSSLDPSQPSSTGMQPNVAAGLAILFSLLGGLIFYLIEKQSQFVRYWAKQGLTLGIVWFGVGIVFTILALMMPLGMLVLWSWVIRLVYLVFWVVAIYGAVQAFSGKVWEIPVITDLSRKFFSN